MTWKSEFNAPQRQNFFILRNVNMALRPIQPPIQRVNGAYPRGAGKCNSEHMAYIFQMRSLQFCMNLCPSYSFTAKTNLSPQSRLLCIVPIL
jgi:hypothetical protein